MIKIKKYIQNNIKFMIFLFVMIAYYIWRMFYIDMLYDELFTGRNFVYRGIVYCITDWRAPNNHILYSELSWLLSHCGNKYIGIRGVSFLAAISNLVLLYQLMKKVFNEKKEILSIGTTMIYASFYIVIYQAIQGRGYTLSITLFLIALHLLFAICTKEKVSGKVAFGYALVLALILYTVAVNVYIVVILSLTGGVVLLLGKNYKRLWQLIRISLLGAIFTFLIYLPTIMGMGMMKVLRKINNLGERDAIHGLGYKAMIQTVLYHPIDCIIDGINSMTGNQFLVKRTFGYMIAHHNEYIREVVQNFTCLGIWINIFLILAITFLVVYQIKKVLFSELVEEQRVQRMFFPLLLLISNMILFFMPIIQRMVTPTRTFAYIAVPVAIGIGLLLEKLEESSQVKKLWHSSKKEWVVWSIMWIYLAISLFLPKSINVCANNERETYEVLHLTDGMKYEKMLIGTIFGKGQIWFETGKEVEDRSMEPEYALLLKEQLDKNITDELYQAQGTYKDMPWDWIEQKMESVYEDNKIIVYKLK